jgi:putative lysine decarboxylase
VRYRCGGAPAASCTIWPWTGRIERQATVAGDFLIVKTLDRPCPIDVVVSWPAAQHSMAGEGQAFVVLPGGSGTLEELFEVVTWAQLGLHTKTRGLLNVAGFYDSLRAFLDRAYTRNSGPSSSTWSRSSVPLSKKTNPS